MSRIPNQKWSQKIIDYFKTNFTFRNTLFKLMWIVVAAIIVITPSTIINEWVQHVAKQQHVGVFYIVINQGVSFSMLMNSSAFLVYLLQSIMCLIIFFVVFFTNEWYYTLLLSIAFMGGLFNVIDRATPCSFLFTIDGYPPNTLIHNVVIDYFTFGGNTAIFNVPDITILIGVIGSCVIYFCLTIYSYIKERNKVSAS